jgi:hypothetical protein
MRPRRPETPNRNPARPALLARFTRVSPTHHRLDLERADGSRESCLLETRSCLVHDLVHFALESEAGLQHSFYGTVARGTAYRTLADPAAGPPSWELLVTEKVVGPLQAAVVRRIEPAAFVAAFGTALASAGDRVPEWLTADLVARVQERMRRLLGAWRATPFGEALTLEFVLDPE